MKKDKINTRRVKLDFRYLPLAQLSKVKLRNRICKRYVVVKAVKDRDRKEIQ